MEHLVVGVQMEIGENLEENFRRMNSWVRRVKFLYPQAKLLIFPELALTGPVHPPMEEKEIVGKFAPMAKENGIWLVPGTFYVKSPKGKVNRAYLFNPEGEVAGHYDKIYPWAPFEDSVPGDEVRVFDVEGLRVGIEICYDVWFPEVALSMAEKGVDLIVNPVMTTTADRQGEKILVRATSLFTQSYVISVNGLGRGGVGDSFWVGPDGEVLVSLAQSETPLPLAVSTERLSGVRERGSFASNKVLKEFLKRRRK